MIVVVVIAPSENVLVPPLINALSVLQAWVDYTQQVLMIALGVIISVVHVTRLIRTSIV